MCNMQAYVSQILRDIKIVWFNKSLMNLKLKLKWIQIEHKLFEQLNFIPTISDWILKSIYCRSLSQYSLYIFVVVVFSNKQFRNACRILVRLCKPCYCFCWCFQGVSERLWYHPLFNVTCSDPKWKLWIAFNHCL